MRGPWGPHRRRQGVAFTLVEMLVATVLSAVLMGAVLAALAGVARDRRTVRSLNRPTATAALDLLEWDLANADTADTDAVAAGTADVLTLVGNDGIDRRSLAPDGRRVRVVYRAAGPVLWRRQEYLDDPARPDPWQERVAGDFRSLTLRPTPGPGPTPVPRRAVIGFTTATVAGEREVTR